jgi:hypothetical protein
MRTESELRAAMKRLTTLGDSLFVTDADAYEHGLTKTLPALEVTAAAETLKWVLGEEAMPLSFDESVFVERENVPAS